VHHNRRKSCCTAYVAFWHKADLHWSGMNFRLPRESGPHAMSAFIVRTAGPPDRVEPDAFLLPPGHGHVRRTCHPWCPRDDEALGC